MITIYGEGFAPYTVENGVLWGVLIASLIVPVALYGLRAIGLFTLAKKAQLKCAFLAFLPCLWLYVVCKLVAEARFFKTTAGKLALLLTAIFTISELLMLTYNFFIYFPLVGNFLAGNEIIICDDAMYAKNVLGLTEFWVADQGIWVCEGGFVYPYEDIYQTIKMLNVVYAVSLVFDMISTIVHFYLLWVLFKRYWPQHYVLALIMSTFFGFTGLFLFIIRNKKPINYNDYLRERYQTYGPYGYYGGPRGPYGNPYNGPYGNGNQGPRANQPAQKGPFEDYVDRSERTPDEPFSEYNNNDKDKRDGE